MAPHKNHKRRLGSNTLRQPLQNTKANDPDQPTRGLVRRSALLGSAGLAASLIDISRSKITALLLGPDGTGLIGQLAGSADLVASLTQLGLEGSGVQHIAENFTGDIEGKDYRVASERVRTIARVSALAGFVAILLFARPLSRIALGDGGQWPFVLGLAPLVFFQALAKSHVCVMGGTRSLKLVAQTRVLTACCSLALGVPIFYLAGMNGVLPYLVGLGLVRLGLVRFLTRGLQPTRRSTVVRASKPSSLAPVLRIGIAVMVSGFATQAGMFAARSVVVDQVELAGVGLYGATLAILGTITSLTTIAVSTEYYPALCSCFTHTAARNHLIGQQVQLLSLITVPAAVLLYIVPDAIIYVLYSLEYQGASRMVQLGALHCLGFSVYGALQYVLIAGHFRAAHVVTNALGALVDFLSVAYCVSTWGIPGLGYGIAASSILKALTFTLASVAVAQAKLPLKAVGATLAAATFILTIEILSLNPLSFATLPARSLIAVAIIALLTVGAGRRLGLLSRSQG